MMVMMIVLLFFVILVNNLVVSEYAEDIEKCLALTDFNIDYGYPDDGSEPSDSGTSDGGTSDGGASDSGASDSGASDSASEETTTQQIPVISHEKKQKHKIVNDHFMMKKFKDFRLGFGNPANFTPFKYFIEDRNLIKNTYVYKFIKGMPKGALLHSYDINQLPADKMLKFIDKKYLYIFTQSFKNETINRFKYLYKKPSPSWVTKSTFLKMVDNPKNFEKNLKKSFTLIRRRHYKTFDELWYNYKETLLTREGLVNSEYVYEEYLKEVLKIYKEDKVLYIEFRSALELYDLNNNTIPKSKVLSIIKKTSDAFMKENKDFFGVNIIYSRNFNVTTESSKTTQTATIIKEIKEFEKLKDQFKTNLVGFDLIGQRDNITSLIYISKALYPYRDKINFLFHDCEFHWPGNKDRHNLQEANILKSRRYGNANNLYKHPQLVKEIKSKWYGVEISPISNFIMKRHEDLNAHPASHFFADNYPSVITNGNPGFWEADGLTDDFYITYMYLADPYANLTFFLWMTFNSIVTSLLPKKQKDQASKILLTQWEDYLDEKFEEINRETNDGNHKPK